MHYNAPLGIAVYLERRKTRQFVGELRYIADIDEFEFTYDRNYLYSKSIIPLGPELPLKKQPFRSKRLFESFSDRIPSKENPAYTDYCKAVGIDVSETNPLILLSTIAKRGPSSFIFEPIYARGIDPHQLKHFREMLNLTAREFAVCFSISLASLNRIETGKATGKEILKRLEIYIKFPEVALFEFQRNSGKIHLQKKRHAEKVLEMVRK